MMTFQELGELLMNHLDLGDCVRECLNAMSYDFVRNTPMMVASGVAARDVLGTYRLKYQSTQRRGLETCGFETLLERLAARPPDETVMFYKIDAPMRFFMVFTSETNELIGCIGVDQRNAAQAKEKWLLDSKLGVKRK
jgi:hypothetical protein